jgi:hypothetical protein
VTSATRRLPLRAISQPAIGIATNDPAPRPISAAPSIPGVSPSAVCTAGIRDTQVAKAKPLMKNSAPTAIRAARDDGATEVCGVGPGWCMGVLTLE